MKLFSKLICLCTILSYSQARESLIITYDKQSKETITIAKKHFEKQGLLSLWTFVESEEPCKENYKESILHLCFRKNDIELKSSKKEVLKRSFSQILE